MANEMRKMRRKLKRKRIRKIIIGVTITLALAVVVVILINIFFVVKNMNITNNTPYNAEEMLEYAGVKEGTSLFSVNEKKIAERLSEKYPYVSAVTAKISLPNTATFTFEQTTASITALASNGKYIIMDDTLKVLEESSVQSPEVLFVIGATIEKYNVGKKLDKSEVLDIDLIQSITEALKNYSLLSCAKTINLTKKYSLTVSLENIMIELGNGEDIDKKFKMAKNVYDKNDPSVKAIINVKNYAEGRYRTVTDE